MKGDYELGWSALSRAMLDDSMVEIRMKGLKIERTLGIVQHASRSISNAGQAFIESLYKTSKKGGGGL